MTPANDSWEERLASAYARHHAALKALVAETDMTAAEFKALAEEQACRIMDSMENKQVFADDFVEMLLAPFERMHVQVEALVREADREARILAMLNRLE